MTDPNIAAVRKRCASVAEAHDDENLREAVATIDVLVELLDEVLHEAELWTDSTLSPSACQSCACMWRGSNTKHNEYCVFERARAVLRSLEKTS